MTIETSNNLKSATTTTGRMSNGSTGSTAKAEARTDTSEPTSNVVLSNQAQTLNRLQDKIANAPEVDTERVAEIKQAIVEGRFNINPERIAEAMLNYDSLLGSS